MVKVLLLEGSEIISIGIRQLLIQESKRNYLIETSSCGADFYKKISREVYHVVLMNSVMVQRLDLKPSLKKLESEKPSIHKVIYHTSNTAFPQGSVPWKNPHSIDISASSSELLKELSNMHKAARKNGIKQNKGSVGSLLSEREVSILEKLSSGETDKVIADKLCLSPRTIGNLRQSLLRKLHAKNTVELVSKSLRSGVIN